MPSGLDQFMQTMQAQQRLYGQNPSAWTPPNPRWGVKDGNVTYTRTDPMTGLQKLFVAGALGFAGAGAGAGLSALTGATSGAGSTASTLAANAGLNAAKTKLGGGSWTDAALSAGTGALPGGSAIGGSGMSWTDLLKNPETWGAIAQIAGGAASGKSDQRMQQTAATNQSNLADLALYTAAQNAQNQAGQLDINRKEFGEDARGKRAKQALLADLLSNLQDVNINVPGVQTAQISGGLRPSAIGAEGRQGLAEMRKQALEAQLKGDTFAGGEILTPPSYRPMPEKGGVESVLDWIGLLGAGAGALGAVKDAQQPGTYSQLPGAQAANTPPSPNYNPNLYRDLRF